VNWPSSDVLDDLNLKLEGTAFAVESRLDVLAHGDWEVTSTVTVTVDDGTASREMVYTLSRSPAVENVRNEKTLEN
jgi:hypothetical protein